MVDLKFKTANVTPFSVSVVQEDPQIIEKFQPKTNLFPLRGKGKPIFSQTVYGVPLGSVLGPLLSLIFISHLQTCPKRLICVFADNTNKPMYFDDHTCNNLFKNGSHQLKFVEKRLDENTMPLNNSNSNRKIFLPVTCQFRVILQKTHL